MFLLTYPVEVILTSVSGWVPQPRHVQKAAFHSTIPHPALTFFLLLSVKFPEPCGVGVDTDALFRVEHQTDSHSLYFVQL